MEFVRKHAHLLKVGEVFNEVGELTLILGTADSWDGGIMLDVLNLETKERYDWFFAAFDELDVLA
jgi:hypothetical protein